MKPLPLCERLKVTTFNCKNTHTCGPIFEKLAKTEDIILVQEHWLFRCKLNLLDEINENFLVSVDYYDPISPVQIPRGYGGVAIFWKRNIDHLVNSLENGNQQNKCIELHTERPTLIICVYMPCNSETDNYHSFVECIENSQELIYTYQGTHEIIILGDFNENALIKNSSKRSICFHKFLNENDILTRYTDHTFIHPNGKETGDYRLSYTNRELKKILSVSIDLRNIWKMSQTIILSH